MKSNLLKTLLGLTLTIGAGSSFAGSFAVATHITSKNNYIVKITPTNNNCILSSGIKDGNALLQKDSPNVNANLIVRLDPNCYIPTRFKGYYTFQAYSYKTGWKTIPYSLIKETDTSSINTNFEIQNYDINLL